MRRHALVLASAAALVVAACGDSTSPVVTDTPDPNIATHPEFNPPNSRSRGLPVLRNARRLRVHPARLDRIRFNIELRYIVPPPASAKAAFEKAQRRWQSIIIKDVEAVEGLLPQSACFPGVLPDFEGTIDDIMIDVVLIPIDGPGNILGAAGPCFVRISDALPVSGVMLFDVDDLAFLESFDLLEEVIVHEMGHVLGFGTLWDYERTLLAGDGTPTPTFTGRLANALYKALGGGRNPIPVEGDYGPGTAYGHWDEERFDNELMTGFINLGENPLSVITAGSMHDLGYGALPLGEPYRLPRVPASGVAASRVQGEGIPIAKQEQLLTPKAAVE